MYVQQMAALMVPYCTLLKQGLESLTIIKLTDCCGRLAPKANMLECYFPVP